MSHDPARGLPCPRPGAVDAGIPRITDGAGDITAPAIHLLMDGNR